MAEKVFTRNWVKRKMNYWNQHIVPVLAGKDRLRYLEIGVFEGRSACWVMENILSGKNCLAYGIDPYIFGRGELMNQREVILNRAVENLAEYNFSFRFDTAHKVLMEDTVINRTKFDLIYIDGDHRAFNAYVDIFLAWPLLKAGGFMVFDDYALDPDRFKRKLGDVPKPAIDFFVQEHATELDVLWTDKQLGIQRKDVD